MAATDCKEFTYTNDPGKTPRDAVRFLVGDTNRSRVLLDDKEVDWAIGENPNQFMAAAMLANHLCGVFSSKADITVGGVSKSLSSIAEAFRKKAKDLKREACTNVRVAFPAITRAGKEALEEDESLTVPSFSRGWSDNPFAAQLDGLFNEDTRGFI